MRTAVGVVLAVVVAGCGDVSFRTGSECNQMNILHCGTDANGSPVALQCQGTPGQWMQVGACPNCDHVTGDQTALVCGGVNVALEGAPCQSQGNAACALQNITHVVTCSFGKWTLSQDCSAMNKVCGYVATATLGCNLPR